MSETLVALKLTSIAEDMRDFPGGAATRNLYGGEPISMPGVFMELTAEYGCRPARKGESNGARSGRDDVGGLEF